MSLFTAPVGQDAYQNVVQQAYQAAWKPYVKTTNRYFAGPPNTSTSAGINTAMPLMGQRCGPRLGFVLVGGAPVLIGNTGNTGSGYVVGDLVTMSPVNGGRSIVVKVLAVTGGAPTSVQILDPGSGLVGGGTGVSSTTVQTAALNQLSTTGVGTGATWSATIGVGLGLGPQPRSDA